MKVKIMKPQPFKYYRWDEIWPYLKDKYGFQDDVPYPDNPDKKFCDIWDYLCSAYGVTQRGLIYFTSWELTYNDGEYAHLFPDFFRPILEKIIEEFGDGEEGAVVTVLTQW